jgi:hypothetical protein
MPVDPRVQMMAQKMGAARQAGRPMQPTPPPARDVPEQPSDDAAIVGEVKILLTKAMELLANIGPGQG